MSNSYAVSASPHLHESWSKVGWIMWQVVIALIPALATAVYFFGIDALLLTLYGVITAALTEAVIQKLRGVPVTIADGSAVLTGMLVSFNIHAASPWWLPVAGAFFAIAIGKQVFGGLGHNPFNPALLARAFMVASWPTLTTGGWIPTRLGSLNGIDLGLLPAAVRNYDKIEAITSATPLGVLKTIRDTGMVDADIGSRIMDALCSLDVISDAWLGNIGGVIGEVSAAALIIGAIYLVIIHVLDWRIPVWYIGTVFVLSWAFGGLEGAFSAPILFPVFSIVTGGLMLGALFMATDMVTSPVTRKGRVVFGIGCGVLTVVIRQWGGYPEGVSYSILLMNMAVPVIDKWTLPKPFGAGR